MNNIKNIPNKLECAYCIRNYSHGGECKSPKFNEMGCLAFKMDSRGCIRNTDIVIPIALYNDIPVLGVWDDNWTMYGVSTEIKMNRIHGLFWDSKKGYIKINCNIDYFINEYHENYIDVKNKPKLKVIKSDKGGE